MTNGDCERCLSEKLQKNQKRRNHYRETTTPDSIKSFSSAITHATVDQLYLVLAAPFNISAVPTLACKTNFLSSITPQTIMCVCASVFAANIMPSGPKSLLLNIFLFYCGASRKERWTNGLRAVHLYLHLSLSNRD